MFNIEPAAIRRPLQRKPGTQERVDLAYLWPSLVPPEPAAKTEARQSRPIRTSGCFSRSPTAASA